MTPTKAQSTLIGNLEVHVLPEVAHTYVDVGFLFNSLTPDEMRPHLDWLDDRFLKIDEQKLGFAFQAYVIRSGRQTILVDSCNGNHKHRPTAMWQHDLRSHAFLSNLAALGLTPEDIDLVVCTHLHCDHVGWNTRLIDGKWRPTFPNAKYLFGQREFDYFAQRNSEGPEAPVNHGAFEDSVLPIVDAGLSLLVDDHHVVAQEVGDRIFLSPSPGHSFGHVCVHAKSSGAEAIVCGDVLHHPIQAQMPDMPMRTDFDATQAAASRRRLLETCESTGALLLAGHIPFWSVGRVHERGSEFEIRPSLRHDPGRELG